MQHRITSCDSRESPPSNCSLPRPQIKKACNRSTAVGRENRFQIRPLCILNGRLIALAPYVSLAQSGKTPSPVTQVVQAEVKKALEAAGYKDVKIDLHTFVVQAKD